ncbi:MAG: response regulator transcription factor [Sphingobacteriaceae bacterium]|nr:MAG: response regulator transcription factor [Sphingobacteriaceae bacterium]
MLVEDHQLVRQGLSAILKAQTDMTVVSEAANGLQALETLKGGINADIIITDIDMQDMDGIELIKQVKESGISAKTIVLSMLDNDRFVIKAVQTGADAYLLKTASSQELLFAIRHVAAGGKYTCTEVAMRLVNKLAHAAESLPDKASAGLDLSERDMEVIELLADGYTNQEIADKLFMNKRTAENYRLRLMSRTGSRNTAALIKFVMRHGILK